MKKVLIVLAVLIFSFNLNFAQDSFFKGAGIFISGTESAHSYTNLDQNKKDFVHDTPTNFNKSYYYPQSHISHEYFNFISAGLFAEFSKRDRVRWQTELEYIKKGAEEKEVINPFIGTRASSFSVNKYKYFEWNNYLKLYYPAGYSSHWYIMPGIRLEYLFSKSTPVFSSVSGNFATFWFSGNLGAGYEWALFKNIYAFTEYHWNPDILAHHIGDIKARNRTLELRIGLIYRPKQRKIDDCNAPKYNGPAY